MEKFFLRAEEMAWLAECLPRPALCECLSPQDPGSLKTTGKELVLSPPPLYKGSLATGVGFRSSPLAPVEFTVLCPDRSPHSEVSLFQTLLSPQTNRTGASLPDASCWKDKAMNTSSFSTHLRRSQSVSSSQAPTWRGHQGKASDRPGQIPHRFGSAGWVQHPPGPGVSKDLKWGARKLLLNAGPVRTI